MKTGLIAVILCSASVAHAGTMELDSFKLVGEKPAVRASRDVQKPIESMRAEVASCGGPIDTRLRQLVPVDMKLHITAAGRVGEVSLDSKLLARDAIDCITRVMGRAAFPARKKASVLTVALVYRRR